MMSLLPGLRLAAKLVLFLPSLAVDPNAVLSVLDSNTPLRLAPLRLYIRRR